MYWQLQMFGERILDLVPFAYRLHRKFEKHQRRERSDTIRDTIVKHKFDHMKFLYETVPFDLRGKKILEIGTGKIGTDITLFYLLGAEEIHTLDAFSHMKLNCVRASLEGLHAVAGDIQMVFDVQDAAAKIADIPADSIENFLRHINAHYHTGKELKDIALDKSSIDFCYTYSCLQCLPVSELERTLNAAQRVLKKGAFLYNDLRFIDNYCKKNNKNPISFLKHSDLTWRTIQSKKFNYHNRLRHSEFLRMMEQYCFEFVAERTEVLEASHLDGVRIHKRFALLHKDDLRIANASMIHRYA